VRELKNYVQRAFILADEVIDAHLAPATVTTPESAPLLAVRVGSTLDEVSRRLIEATLAECGSKRKAADMLGISLKTLYNRLAAYKSEDMGKRRAPAENEEYDEHDHRDAA
jgi:DNA-binding NtrC family response regulator